MRERGRDKYEQDLISEFLKSPLHLLQDLALPLLLRDNGESPSQAPRPPEGRVLRCRAPAPGVCVCVGGLPYAAASLPLCQEAPPSMVSIPTSETLDLTAAHTDSDQARHSPPQLSQKKPRGHSAKIVLEKNHIQDHHHNNTPPPSKQSHPNRPRTHCVGRVVRPPHSGSDSPLQGVSKEQTAGLTGVTALGPKFSAAGRACLPLKRTHLFPQKHLLSALRPPGPPTPRPSLKRSLLSVHFALQGVCPARVVMPSPHSPSSCDSMTNDERPADPGAWPGSAC